METVINYLELIVFTIAEGASLVLELFGALILVYKGVQGFYYWIDKNDETTVKLGEGIAMALEFLMAAEVLHTIIAKDLNDLVILAALVLVRGLMTFEIHMEIKNERAQLTNDALKEASDPALNAVRFPLLHKTEEKKED